MTGNLLRAGGVFSTNQNNKRMKRRNVERSMMTAVAGILAIGTQAQITKLFVSSYDNNIWLDYASSPPSLNYTGQGGGFEGCAHAEDNDGNTLFWVQAVGAYDATNTPMPGSLGMYADPSSAEINICPIPGDPDKFYVIYNDQVCSPLYYSIIDMSLNGGLGDVAPGTLNTLIDPASYSEGLEVVRVPCQPYLWLLAYDCNQGPVRFRIDADGIGDPELMQSFPSPSGYDGRGEFDYHNGKVGMAFAWTPTTFFADFDPVTGIMTNFNSIDMPYPPGSFNGMYGMEFSPDANYAYTSRWYYSGGGEDNFFVVDLTGPTPVVFDQMYLQPDGSSFFTSLGEIELGPDGNLYMVIDGSNEVKVIENANTPATLSFSTITTTAQLALGMDDPIQSDLSGIIIGGGIPDEDPIVPNVFTPNGDGENDNFTVGGISTDLVSDFSLRVYNRWGQEVANTTNVKGWNGRVSGDDAPAGVYYFLLDLAYEARGCGGELLDSKRLETQKGWVQVLR